MTHQIEKKGSCLCGAVNITIKNTNDSVGACHCSMCRKWGGGPLLAIECGKDVHVEGEDNITVYNSSDWAERGFCKKCGSHLFYRLKKEEEYAIPVGLLKNGEHWSLDMQIFIDEKPAFYTFANETKNMTGKEVFAQYTQSSE